MAKRKVEDASSTQSVREGSADITFDGPASAFYNPAQEFNRDLTCVTSLSLFLPSMNTRAVYACCGNYLTSFKSVYATEKIRRQ